MYVSTTSELVTVTKKTVLARFEIPYSFLPALLKLYLDFIDFI